MRLRPLLATTVRLPLSFSAMEQYYQDQGRDWERHDRMYLGADAQDPNKTLQAITSPLLCIDAILILVRFELYEMKANYVKHVVVFKRQY